MKLGKDETSRHPDLPVGQKCLWWCNWGGWVMPWVMDRSAVAVTSPGASMLIVYPSAIRRTLVGGTPLASF